MSIFRQFKRVWCADQCGSRILLTAWHRTHGQVCFGCHVKAMEQADRDIERKALRFASDAALERF
jgi:hypothetical protein